MVEIVLLHKIHICYSAYAANIIPININANINDDEVTNALS